MRTGIYIYKSTNVTIECSEDGLQLAQLGGKLDYKTLQKSTPLTLEPGIYRVLSREPIKVTGPDLAVQSAVGKDPWPDPDPKVKDFFDSKELKF